jgi:hypothetical protein
MAEARIGARDQLAELVICEGLADEGAHDAERHLLVGSPDSAAMSAGAMTGTSAGT